MRCTWFNLSNNKAINSCILVPDRGKPIFAKSYQDVLLYKHLLYIGQIRTDLVRVHIKDKLKSESLSIHCVINPG